MTKLWLWEEEVLVALPWSYVPPMSLWPLCLSRLCLRLSRPALPIWDVPARIRLLPGEGCYLPSNLFGGFSGVGTWWDGGSQGCVRGWQ